MKSKKKSIFKKVFASMAVASILISGSVLSGYAAYVQVGNTINGFSLSMKDGTSFGLGNVPAGTQIDQTESYVTIFNDYDYTEGYAYARSTATQSSIGWGQYYNRKKQPLAICISICRCSCRNLHSLLVKYRRWWFQNQFNCV